MRTRNLLKLIESHNRFYDCVSQYMSEEHRITVIHGTDSDLKGSGCEGKYTLSTQSRRYPKLEGLLCILI